MIISKKLPISVPTPGKSEPTRLPIYVRPAPEPIAIAISEEFLARIFDFEV
jgi:hypothetical protein